MLTAKEIEKDKCRIDIVSIMNLIKLEKRRLENPFLPNHEIREIKKQIAEYEKMIKIYSNKPKAAANRPINGKSQ